MLEDGDRPFSAVRQTVSDRRQSTFFDRNGRPALLSSNLREIKNAGSGVSGDFTVCADNKLPDYVQLAWSADYRANLNGAPDQIGLLGCQRRLHYSARSLAEIRDGSGEFFNNFLQVIHAHVARRFLSCLSPGE
ncbi:hypothetical protein [Burkholderia contaminans]|uniref:hypothetical protein n=1 Tax=Burkholderia contaminans TaxID=488447 RepID=UPI0015821808|nr:hypothetical protein [Burkholderia contaminans]